MDHRIALLREGYVQGLIDLEAFEEFVGWIVEGRQVALPIDVAQLGVRFRSTDAPGGVDVYRPIAPSMWGVLKTEWTESQFTS